MFPYESIPDGAVFAPHHLHYAVLTALLVAAVIWDDYPKREPGVLVAGLLVAEFGFIATWPYYPATGAALALAGLTVATLPVLHAVAVLAARRAGFDRERPYWAIFPWHAVFVCICLLVAWDDLANHAFGVPTPLDHIWNVYIYEHVP
jgi:predicted lysophospholipase L1 biosynthesis ABC-type transport system permease subunit